MTNVVELRPPNPFERFWRMGYRKLVPIVPPGVTVSKRSSLAARPDAVGKSPGVRGFDGLWRGFDWVRHTTTEADLAGWHEMGAGVGFKTGPQDDGTSLVGIDADTLDRPTAEAIAALVERCFGPLPARVGRSPKMLYLLRVTGELRYSCIKFGPAENQERVELLSTGRQFVAHGVHPVTMKPYEWRRPLVPYAELPVVAPEALV
jgi:hypothetical protein